jgi:HK97 family phage portal protein
MFYDLGGNKGIAPAEDILHFRNSMSRNGKVGESSIRLMAETIGLAAAAEKHGAAVFGNGARPGGYLKFPGKLEKPAKDKIKADWEEMHRGVQLSNRVAVLAEGMEFAESAVSHENLQYLETRTFQAYQICGFFRVAPHLAGIMDKATFSNIEHQGQQHANNAILPTAIMWEEELMDKLLFEDEQEAGLYFEFLMDGIIRADYKTRMEGYQMAIGNSIMTPNEARAKENMNKHPDADFLMRPMNMAVVGQEEPTE